MKPFKFFNTFVSPDVDWDCLFTSKNSPLLRRFEILTHFNNWNSVMDTISFYNNYSYRTTIVSMHFDRNKWVQGRPTFKTNQRFEIVFAVYLNI